MVSFRDLEEATNDARALFGNKDARGIVLLRPYAELAGHELLAARDYPDYQSIYLNLYAEFRGAKEAEKESIEKGREARGNGADLEMDALMKVQRAIDSSVTLRNKRDLILDFTSSMTVTGDVNDDWQRFVAAKLAEELNRIITEESLKHDETHAFVEAAFRDGAVPTSGTAITRILSPVSRFSPSGGQAAKRQAVIGCGRVQPGRSGQGAVGRPHARARQCARQERRGDVRARLSSRLRLRPAGTGRCNRSSYRCGRRHGGCLDAGATARQQ